MCFILTERKRARSSAPVSKVEQFILLSTEIRGYRRGQKKTEWTDEELSDCFMCDYVRVFDEIKITALSIVKIIKNKLFRFYSLWIKAVF